MKRKSDLKRKVLCSLLAASTMGIFYSSDALAADLPVDHILVNGSQENSKNVGELVAGDKSYIYGITGGDAYLDETTKTAINGLNSMLIFGGDSLKDIANVVGQVNDFVKSNTTSISNSKPAVNDTIGGLYLQNYGKQDNVVRYYGAIGGDIVINANLNSMGYDKTSVSAETGARDNQIIGGSVIGGVGGSAAVGIGNISASASVGRFNMNYTTGGEAHATVNGNVETTQGKEANVIGFMNGGLAAGVGSTATSTVNGNTVYTLDGTGRSDHAGADEKPGDGDILPELTTVLNIMENSKISAIGIAGGGTALSTIGGTAESTVNGTTTINIKNATVIGTIGGGIAGAVDAAGLLNKGNNNGVSDTEISGIKIEVGSAIEGGTAKANVQDTAINLEGNTVAGGIIGGGLALASHNYAVRNGFGEAPADYEAGDPLGSSYAESNIGTSNIHINLDSETLLNGNVSFSDIKNNLLNGDENTGIAVGVFGGGAAAAVGDANSKAVANADAVNMYIENGYVAGAFGNGLALSVYDKGTSKTDADSTLTAKSETTGDINITVDKGAKVVGLFGNGLAAGVEATINKNNTAEKNTANGENPNAEVVANNTNINVLGAVDGVIGGGLTIANGYYHGDKSVVADTRGTSTINIYDGSTIDKFSYGSLNNALNALKDFEIGGQKITQLGDLIGEKLNYYVTDLDEAAGDAAIIGGAVAVGQGGYGHVQESIINVMGGEVKGDIIAGGISSVTNVDTSSGVVVDESTINLVAGTVEGDIYAGGVKNSGAYDVTNVYKDKEAAKSSVKNSVINLGDTDVKGVISGKGYNYTSTGAKEDYKAEGDISTLNLVGSGETALTLVDNGSKIKNFDNINATANSVTKVEGLNDTTALIDATGAKVTVDGSAKLDISALEMGTDGTGNTYKVISNTDEDDVAWIDSNLVYDRTEGYATGSDVTSGSYDVTYKELASLTEEEQTEAVNDFVDSLGEGGSNFEGIAGGIIRNGANTNSGAKQFFSEYTGGNGTGRDLAAMAMIGEAAGVTSNTISVAGDMADNSVLRLSFTQDNITGEPKVNEDGAVWAKYIHNKHDLDGMASSFGSIDSSSDFDGATIGVDFAKKGKVQSGIAFSYGDGDSHGMGINNDFDMWGVTLYGNVKNDDTNVIADIGYSESDNELKGTAMGKRIKADRDVSVFTLGVRAEKLYTNGNTQIVPYTGLRYYNVDPDSYTAYYDGAKFGVYDADRQNIWTLPLGVSLRNETVTGNGWRLTPKVDVAYIWAFGDTDNSFDLNTGSGADTFDYTVMDSGSWLTSVGFEAGKGDWNFGLGYSYQKGSHAEANKWFVNAEYSF